ncbi:MAG: succinylglutamate desuccinylase/aspartoacylase family protein [Tepidiformaceae bacterium]
MREPTRRDLLKLGLGVGAFAVTGCGRESQASGVAASPRSKVTVPGIARDEALPPTPTPAPTPRPVPPKSRSERLLVPGSASETSMFLTFSGKTGPTLLVLGGVHGNEPGGWLAAEEIASWVPSAGGLIVLPRANRLAAASFVRTTEALGDLNRLYPGSPTSALPMERLAAEIVAVANEYGVDVTLDLHESWAFFNGRSQNGTAFLGQTVTTGIGPRNPALGREVIVRVNAGIGTERDLLVERDGASFRADPTLGAPGPDQAGRGRSSLSLGGHVRGLTPLLVEMGQEDQAIERRTELHLLVARATVEILGIG